MKRFNFGFTIIDLLGVFVILLLFAGLIFPFLQSNREQSRRVACSAKLKLLGEKIIQYESANHKLPAHKHGPQSSKRISAFTDLLPFLNYESLYKEIVETKWQVPWRKEKVGTDGKPILDDNKNQIPGPYCKTISEILCPVDSAGFNLEPFSNGCTNYVFSHGDWITGTNETFSRGVFAPDTWRQMKDIVDGNSYTIAMSERIISPLTYSGKSVLKESNLEIPFQVSMRGGVLIGMGVIVSEKIDKQNFIPCFNAVSKNVFTDLDNSLKVNIEWSCRRWADGQHVFTSMNTIFPPNVSSCAAETNDQSALLMPPASYHVNGVNVLLLDGQVRFISNKIDYGGDYTTKHCIKTGSSPFGVWGALGSINDSDEKKVEVK
ncbi:MAG: DUF1559 domain-containing protein [Planctomycetaceae bacterium]|jgi:prepilin-type processing-associated H-X9-DG protein|nr:DUF1559 domain-containing protein [Planctomycetaceae bacterium]